MPRKISQHIPNIPVAEINTTDGFSGKCVLKLIEAKAMEMNRKGNEEVYKLKKKELALQHMREKKELMAGIWWHAGKGALDHDALQCIRDRIQCDEAKKMATAEKKKNEAMGIIKACQEVIEKKGLDHTKWVNKELTTMIRYLKVSGDPKLPTQKNELVKMFLDIKHRKPLPPPPVSADADNSTSVVECADDDGDEMDAEEIDDDDEVMVVDGV